MYFPFQLLDRECCRHVHKVKGTVIFLDRFTSKWPLPFTVEELKNISLKKVAKDTKIPHFARFSSSQEVHNAFSPKNYFFCLKMKYLKISFSSKFFLSYTQQ